MPDGLHRYHDTGRSHFVTFSCYQRRPYFSSREIYDLFPECLERTRLRFDMCVYGYVVMPEHVHLLLSEPERGSLSDALHYLKLSFAKRARSLSHLNAQPMGVKVGHSPARKDPFWQKRYHDRNVRDGREFTIKLRYLHRNPVKRGLVKEAALWKWSSFRHYAYREFGVVEIESEWAARDREVRALGLPPRIFLCPDELFPTVESKPSK